jgi:hypothetical protein
VPHDFGCDSGIGVEAASYQGVYLGLTGPYRLTEFERDGSLNVAERDADKVIATNNRSACKASQAHTTLAIVTMLSRTVKDPSTSADFVGLGSLRGVALAQAGYNAGHPNDNICLVIDNLGDSETAASAIPSALRRLALYARYDPTFGGIVGLPFSDQAKSAIDSGFPGGRSIPVVSPTASSMELSDKPGFHRIVSPDEAQAGAMATFLSQQTLLSSSTTVGIIKDDTNTYVASLASEIQTYLHSIDKLSPDRVQVYQYRLHDLSSLRNQVMKALRDGRSYLYFSGYAYDLNTVEDTIESYQQADPTRRAPVTILGGDGICDLESYVQNPYVPVICTGYAGPINVKVQHSTPCGSDFAAGYRDRFDNNLPQDGPWTLYPSDAILWYDAVCAAGQAIADRDSRDASVTLADSLRTVSFTGLTGTTTFSVRPGASSDPDAKDIYIQCADRQRGLHVLWIGDKVTSTSYDSINSCGAGRQ